MRKRLFIPVILSVLLCACGSNEVQERNTGVSEEIASQNMEDDTKEEADVSSKQAEVGSNGMYLSDMPDAEEKVLENLKISSEKTVDGDIVVFVKNENEYVIPDIELQAVYYKDGKIIDTSKDGHDVLVPENIVVSKLDAPDNYDDYDIQTSIEWDTSSAYRNWIYNLGVESNIGDDNVIIQFENKGKVDIEELEYIVLFYLNGELVDTSYTEEVRDFRAGDNAIEEVSVYRVEFDAYSIYINQAHTFNKENVNSSAIGEELPDNIMTKLIN